jgi:hypothetical protein
MFDARCADADRSLLFPEAEGDFKGDDCELNRFLRDVDAGRRKRLTQIGEATGTAVQRLVQALFT